MLAQSLLPLLPLFGFAIAQSSGVSCATEYGQSKRRCVKTRTSTVTESSLVTVTTTVGNSIVTVTPEPAIETVTVIVTASEVTATNSDNTETVLVTSTSVSLEFVTTTTVVSATSTFLPTFTLASDSVAIGHQKRGFHDDAGAVQGLNLEREVGSHNKLYPIAVVCSVTLQISETTTVVRSMSIGTRILNSTIVQSTTIISTPTTTVPVTATITTEITVTSTSTSISTLTDPDVFTATSWVTKETGASPTACAGMNYQGLNPSTDPDYLFEGIVAVTTDPSDISTDDTTIESCCTSCVNSDFCAGTYFNQTGDPGAQCWHMIAADCSSATGQDTYTREFPDGWIGRVLNTTGIIVSNGYCGIWKGASGK